MLNGGPGNDNLNGDTGICYLERRRRPMTTGSVTFSMDPSVFPRSAEEWSERMRGAGPPRPDDQSRTWDGRVLDTKEAVLEFLAEAEEARRSGQSLGPDDPKL